MEGLGDPSLDIKGLWDSSSHILIKPPFYRDSISKSIILYGVDQVEGVGYISANIKIEPTFFLDIILKEWVEYEGLDDPSLYIDS